ncbi:hypothetical protein QYE76_014982 [Lolium multiflorum]|uniref:Retrotransposon gag domain-containing protein n=1 Tax=Lolium multiflorum TaxID=4521 RepID=A0AAD8X7B2_LOLMU|nr:hypothetical protein QYE76_014982 [Lolium multiflorum]
MSFWLDKWLPGSPLAERFPALFSHYTRQHATVATVVARGLDLQPRLTTAARAKLSLICQIIDDIRITPCPTTASSTLPRHPASARGRYEEETSIARGGEEQLDMKTNVKMDVKLDMELDMKISHGRAREEREACARGEVDVQAGPAPKDKDAAYLMTWRDFEALRNEMRREFRIEDDELRGTIDEINQKMDTTNETVTAMADQMTDIQRTLQTLQLAVDNLTNQQQQAEDADDAPSRGDRPRGWAPLGRHGRGQDGEDGLGNPKFSIPKFEGGADVEEYLTWELKIEKLWSLHPNYTEDRKVKLASSEFDGYALRWWDALVRNCQADGELHIITWRAMKEAMNSRFVPTNYLRTIFDKLTLLRQGVKTVDEYYMEMEMLMQRGRVRESLEMTMQRFLNGLKYDVKGIVRHYIHQYESIVTSCKRS